MTDSEVAPGPSVLPPALHDAGASILSILPAPANTARKRAPAPPPTPPLAAAAIAVHPFVSRALASWNGTRSHPRLYGGSTVPGVCTLWWTAQPAAVPSTFIVCSKDIDTGESMEDLARVEAWRVGVTLRDARLTEGRRLDFYLLREASGPAAATASSPARQLACRPAATIVVGGGLSPMMAATYNRVTVLCGACPTV